MLQLQIVVPGWHTTILTFPFIVGTLLTLIACIILLAIIVIKLLKVHENRYSKFLNWMNLALCILGALILIFQVQEISAACYNGYFEENIAFLKRTLGAYFYFYFIPFYLPLILTQLFWRKRNRLNINLTLAIVISNTAGYLLNLLY